MILVQADREKLWNSKLEPYFRMELNFPKDIIGLINDIFYGVKEIHSDDPHIHDLLNRGGDQILLCCMHKQNPSTWSAFFNIVLKNWLDIRYPDSMGEAYIKEKRKQLLFISRAIDPADQLFRSWQFGWTDEEDLEYYKFWYGVETGELMLDLPQEWDDIFTQSRNIWFKKICSGLCSYIMGGQRPNGRYAHLYECIKVNISMFDPSIFAPDSYLGRGELCDVKTGISSLLYAAQQKNFVIESFNERSPDFGKHDLSMYPPETIALSGEEVWDCDFVCSMREKILQDVADGVYPATIQELSRVTSYPDISIDSCITSPTRSKSTPFYDPWTAPQDKIYLRTD